MAYPESGHRHLGYDRSCCSCAALIALSRGVAWRIWRACATWEARHRFPSRTHRTLVNAALVLPLSAALTRSAPGDPYPIYPSEPVSWSYKNNTPAYGFNVIIQVGS